MQGIAGTFLKKKIDKYYYSSNGKNIKVGVILDETDESVIRNLLQIQRHKIFNSFNTNFLSFKFEEVPSDFELCYSSKNLTWNKWPKSEIVDLFLSNNYDYFIPIVGKWKPHFSSIFLLAKAKIKVVHAETAFEFLDWDLAINMEEFNPLTYLDEVIKFIR